MDVGTLPYMVMQIYVNYVTREKKNNKRKVPGTHALKKLKKTVRGQGRVKCSQNIS